MAEKVGDGTTQTKNGSFQNKSSLYMYIRERQSAEEKSSKGNPMLAHRC